LGNLRGEREGELTLFGWHTILESSGKAKKKGEQGGGKTLTCIRRKKEVKPKGVCLISGEGGKGSPMGSSPSTVPISVFFHSLQKDILRGHSLKWANLLARGFIRGKKGALLHSEPGRGGVDHETGVGLWARKWKWNGGALQGIEIRPPEGESHR